MSLDGGEEGPPPNPYAFPSDGKYQDCTDYQRGMPLRDYFAAMAIAPLMSAPRGLRSPTALAEVAYQMADAMLVARMKKRP